MKVEHLIPVICYKTKEPVYYNKGTQWEKTEDTFLMFYSYGTKEEAQKIADELNNNHPAEYHGHKLDWDKIDYFFVSEQEPFGD